MKKTFLNKAFANLAVAKNIYSSFDDDSFLIMMGFHIQQAIEIMIKFVLKIRNVECSRIHDIRRLIQFAKEEGINLFLPEYIEDHAEMFTYWEMKYQEFSDCVPEKRFLEKGFNSALEYYDTVKKKFGIEDNNEALQQIN